MARLLSGQIKSCFFCFYSSVIRFDPIEKSFPWRDPSLSSSPLPLLLQEVSEVVTLVHVVGVLAFFHVQLLDGAAVALLSHQQLTQHPPVRLLVLLLQTLQLGTSKDAVKTPWALKTNWIAKYEWTVATDLSDGLLIDTGALGLTASGETVPLQSLKSWSRHGGAITWLQGLGGSRFGL